MDNELMLFALDSSREYGERVSRHLGIALSPHEEKEFEDGEHKSRPLISVRGRDVFVIASLYADRQQSVADKLCRLLFFIGALKDAAATRVTAIVPYLGYARKDRKTQPRDPVTTRYVAALFEAVDTDCIVTLDVHNLSAYQNAYRCSTEHLEANQLFVRYFAALLQDHEVVVVAPDAGAIKRAEHFRQSLARVLGKPVGTAFAEKYRSQGIVSGEMIVGEVKDKYAIIIDDLISTGTTIARTASRCHALGAMKVYAAASHGLFLGDALAVLADDALDLIAVTDTVPPHWLGAGPVKTKLSVLDSTELFSEAIRRMHDGGSITDLLES